MLCYTVKRIQPPGLVNDCDKRRIKSPSADAKLPLQVAWVRSLVKELRSHMHESESRSVMSDSLQPRGLYSPWNGP